MGSGAIKSSVMSIPGLDGQVEQDAEVDVPNVLHKALQRAAEGWWERSECPVWTKLLLFTGIRMNSPPLIKTLF